MILNEKFKMPFSKSILPNFHSKIIWSNSNDKSHYIILLLFGNWLVIFKQNLPNAMKEFKIKLYF